jgi:heparinase II/III-like protein
MGPSEIGGRARMEASKLWDRMAAPGRAQTPAWSSAEAARRLEAFREEGPGRFFAGAVAAGTREVVAGRLPEAFRSVVAAAEEVTAGRFDLLGYHGLDFGDPIDWHFDPVSGRRVPLVHWSRLDPLDAATVGDSKVVWELNRHQWLLPLGQAYALTGDERYADAFARNVGRWLAANPAGWGINWASSLEVALRLMAWCWALVLFRRSPALTPELFARMCSSIEDHARHVERYLSRYFSPNTHLTGEALGLFHAGALFPDLRLARRWRARGARILDEEGARQVLPDGVYFEQATCYQRYTVEIGLSFLILGARTGHPVPPAVAARVQAMLDFLLAVRGPDGRVAAIGDADGGWLLPLTRRSAGDLRGVFGVAAALFRRPDYAWAAGGLVPELAWLLGPHGVETFDALRPAPPAGAPSRLFPDGGYVTMRDGWDAEGHHLVFDVGPLGCPVSGGHGHADLLGIQCSAFGLPFLVDPGTGTYADPAWRTFFRSTAAHSTVTVDGQGQAEPAGPFAWRERPRARLVRWLSTDGFDVAQAEHEAYGRLPDPVRHRRQVLFVKPRFWVVVDELEGRGRHQVDLRFQFAPVAVHLGPGLGTRAVSGGRALVVWPFAEAALEARRSHGAQGPIEGWVSAEYGQRRPAPMVVYSATAALPLRIMTLLLPLADAAAPLPDVSPRRDARGLSGLVFGDGGESVTLGADGVLVHSR